MLFDRISPIPRRNRRFILPQPAFFPAGCILQLFPIQAERLFAVLRPDPGQAFGHEPFLQARTIRKDDDGHSAAIAIMAELLYVHGLSVTEAACCLSCAVAPGLLLFRAVYAVQADFDRLALIAQDCDGVAVAHANHFARPGQNCRRQQQAECCKAKNTPKVGNNAAGRPTPWRFHTSAACREGSIPA